jgi:hypothetical protein
MKRLDVTIQSFLWGEKAQGKEGEIAAAIRAQRAFLSDSPPKFTVGTKLAGCWICSGLNRASERDLTSYYFKLWQQTVFVCFLAFPSKYAIESLLHRHNHLS